MAYQKVVDFVRDTATEINPSGTFVHGRRWDFSLEFNEPITGEAERPEAHIYLYPITSEKDISGGPIVSYSNLVIGFYYQDSSDSSNEERETLIAMAEVLCNRFIATVAESDEFDISNIQDEPVYREFAGTFTGYLLKCKLKTSESLCS